MCVYTQALAIFKSLHTEIYSTYYHFDCITLRLIAVYMCVCLLLSFFPHFNLFSLFLCACPFSFVYTWKIPSQPHLIIWSCFFTSTTSFPTFFTLINSLISFPFYIITALLSSNSPPWEAWRCISSHVDSGSTNHPSRLAASAYALLLPSWPTQTLLVSLLSISRASSDLKVDPENSVPLKTKTREIHLRCLLMLF